MAAIGRIPAQMIATGDDNLTLRHLRASHQEISHEGL